MARFGVLGLDGERELIRSLARRLADNTPESDPIRATVSRTVSGGTPCAAAVFDGRLINLHQHLQIPLFAIKLQKLSPAVTSQLTPHLRIPPQPQHRLTQGARIPRFKYQPSLLMLD
jgi:hypothetical protein